MFFGAGLIYRAIGLVHRVFPPGRSQGLLGAGLVTGALLTKVMLAPDVGDPHAGQVPGSRRRARARRHRALPPDRDHARAALPAHEPVLGHGPRRRAASPRSRAAHSGWRSRRPESCAAGHRAGSRPSAAIPASTLRARRAADRLRLHDRRRAVRPASPRRRSSSPPTAGSPSCAPEVRAVARARRRPGGAERARLSLRLARELDAAGLRGRRPRSPREIGARHGTAVAAIAFYGSCLRRRTSEGVLDFYAIVDDYRSAYRSPALAAVNALLPPNVFYLELDSGAARLRAKYAVVSRADLARACRGETHRAGIWARFAQPIAAAFARDASARDALAAACADAVCTALRAGLATRAHGWQPAESGRALARGLSRHVCGGAAPRARGRERRDLRRSVRALRRAARRSARGACSRAGRPERGSDGAVRVRTPLARAPGRSAAAKWIGALQLAKTAATFGDWVPYALWKVERHSRCPPRGERAAAPAPVAVRLAAACSASGAAARCANEATRSGATPRSAPPARARPDRARPRGPRVRPRARRAAPRARRRARSAPPRPRSRPCSPDRTRSRAPRTRARAPLARDALSPDHDHAARVRRSAHDALADAHQLALAARVDAPVSRTVGARHLADARVDAEPAQRARRPIPPCARSARGFPARSSVSGVHHANASVSVVKTARPTPPASRSAASNPAARAARTARARSRAGADRSWRTPPRRRAVEPQRLGPRAGRHLAQDRARDGHVERGAAPERRCR